MCGTVDDENEVEPGCELQIHRDLVGFSSPSSAAISKQSTPSSNPFEAGFLPVISIPMACRPAWRARVSHDHATAGNHTRCVEVDQAAKGLAVEPGLNLGEIRAHRQVDAQLVTACLVDWKIESQATPRLTIDGELRVTAPVADSESVHVGCAGTNSAPLGNPQGLGLQRMIAHVRFVGNSISDFSRRWANHRAISVCCSEMILRGCGQYPMMLTRENTTLRPRRTMLPSVSHCMALINGSGGVSERRSPSKQDTSPL